MFYFQFCAANFDQSDRYKGKVSNPEVLGNFPETFQRAGRRSTMATRREYDSLTGDGDDTHILVPRRDVDASLRPAYDLRLM